MIGAALGQAIYIVNLYMIAPVAFPWFEMGRNWVGAFSHLMFGAVLPGARLLLLYRAEKAEADWPVAGTARLRDACDPVSRAHGRAGRGRPGALVYDE